MKPGIGSLVALLAVVGLAVLWVNNCSGPQPQVQGVQAHEPNQPGDPYIVEAVVANRGPGHGEAQVTFHLDDPASGRSYSEQRTVQLQEGATAHVTVEIYAAPGDYRPSAEVEYPPR